MKQLVALAATIKTGQRTGSTRDKSNNRGDWIALLLDAHDWQAALLNHFFNKADATTKAAAFTRMHHQLSTACKHTKWIPFTQGELLVVSNKWGKHKSTGVDGIAHEAPSSAHLAPHLGAPSPRHAQRSALHGQTTRPGRARPHSALPKGRSTRPITLGSAVLKTLAQLLLLRGTPCLQHLNTYQWAAPRRQGAEFILTLRKIARMGADWGATSGSSSSTSRKPLIQWHRIAWGNSSQRKSARPCHGKRAFGWRCLTHAASMSLWGERSGGEPFQRRPPGLPGLAGAVLSTSGGTS